MYSIYCFELVTISFVCRVAMCIYVALNVDNSGMYIHLMAKKVECIHSMGKLWNVCIP